MSSMSVDSSLSAVKDIAFLLNEQTGVLTLAIQPTGSMHGMFEFNVAATDPGEDVLPTLWGWNKLQSLINKYVF